MNLVADAHRILHIDLKGNADTGLLVERTGIGNDLQYVTTSGGYALLYSTTLIRLNLA